MLIVVKKQPIMPSKKKAGKTHSPKTKLPAKSKYKRKPKVQRKPKVIAFPMQMYKLDDEEFFKKKKKRW